MASSRPGVAAGDPAGRRLVGDERRRAPGVQLAHPSGARLRDTRARDEDAIAVPAAGGPGGQRLDRRGRDSRGTGACAAVDGLDRHHQGGTLGLGLILPVLKAETQATWRRSPR